MTLKKNVIAGTDEWYEDEKKRLEIIDRVDEENKNKRLEMANHQGQYIGQSSYFKGFEIWNDLVDCIVDSVPKQDIQKIYDETHSLSEKERRDWYAERHHDLGRYIRNVLRDKGFLIDSFFLDDNWSGITIDAVEKYGMQKVNAEAEQILEDKVNDKYYKKEKLVNIENDRPVIEMKGINLIVKYLPEITKKVNNKGHVCYTISSIRKSFNISNDISSEIIIKQLNDILNERGIKVNICEDDKDIMSFGFVKGMYEKNI